MDNINLYWLTKFFTYSSIQAKLIATFLAWYIFKEVISFNAFICALLVLIGLIIIIQNKSIKY